MEYEDISLGHFIKRYTLKAERKISRVKEEEKKYIQEPTIKNRVKKLCPLVPQPKEK